MREAPLDSPPARRDWITMLAFLGVSILMLGTAYLSSNPDFGVHHQMWPWEFFDSPAWLGGERVGTLMLCLWIVTGVVMAVAAFCCRSALRITLALPLLGVLLLYARIPMRAPFLSGWGIDLLVSSVLVGAGLVTAGRNLTRGRVLILLGCLPLLSWMFLLNHPHLTPTADGGFGMHVDVMYKGVWSDLSLWLERGQISNEELGDLYLGKRVLPYVLLVVGYLLALFTAFGLRWRWYRRFVLLVLAAAMTVSGITGAIGYLEGGESTRLVESEWMEILGALHSHGLVLWWALTLLLGGAFSRHAEEVSA